MRDAWFIARKDVQYMIRERVTILWTFVMPVVFFYFIGTITGGFGGDAPAADPIAVSAPGDAGFLAAEIEGRLVERGFATVPPDSLKAFGAARRRLRLPAALTDSALAGRPAEIGFSRTGDGDAGMDYDRIRAGRAVYTVLADLTVLRVKGVEPTPEAFRALRAKPRSLNLRVSAAGRMRKIPGGFDQAIPGTLVMFTLLVLLTSGAVLLVVERRLGLLRRLAATPISRPSIVTGKWTARMILGLIQIGFALITGSLLFGMTWGPDFPMVLAVLFAYAGMNASLGLLLGSLARTEGQSVGIGVFTANILSALGGCWWPIEVTPKWMQTLSLFLPTGWAMDALHRLVSFGSGAASAVPHVAILSLLALGFGLLAVRFFRYE